MSHQNEIAMHTSHTPCTMQANTGTGIVGTTKCDDTTGPRGDDGTIEGCGVTAPSDSFGDGFNKKGAGVYALLVAEDNIKVWSWESGKVPSDVKSGKPQASGTTWGKPVMDFAKGTCNISEAWKKMKIVSPMLA